jgi:DNA-binding CsgD family transcriptional regulator
MQSLVSLLRAAVASPTRWREFLDQISVAAGGEGAVLVAFGTETERSIASRSLVPVINDWLALGSGQYTRRPRYSGRPRFLTDLDLFSKEELDKDAVYVDFLRPRGLGWSVGTSIQMASGDTLILTVQRAYAKGPVEGAVVQQLDALRPDLIEALLLAERNSIERLGFLLDSLQHVGVAAAAVGPMGKIVRANGHFSRYQRVFGVTGGRMLLTDPARAEMTKVLRISASPEAGAQTWSVAIPGTIADPPTLVRVLPLEDCSYVFTGASALLVPTALERQKAPNQQLLVTMFGLTRAEARVGSLLAAGIPAKVIAQLQGVTTHTIRMQLKSVYRKLGVRRQAEVINMLARSPS